VFENVEALAKVTETIEGSLEGVPVAPFTWTSHALVHTNPKNIIMIMILSEIAGKPEVIGFEKESLHLNAETLHGQEVGF